MYTKAVFVCDYLTETVRERRVAPQKVNALNIYFFHD